MKSYFFLLGMLCFLLLTCISTNIDKAKIKFDNTDLYFGTINAGDTIKLIFNFENIGEDTLFIVQLKPSCECMVVNYTSAPIFPKNHGVIEVKYASNKKEDIGKQVKSIIVQTNSDPLLTVLKVTGIVKNDSLENVINNLKKI